MNDEPKFEFQSSSDMNEGGPQETQNRLVSHLNINIFFIVRHLQFLYLKTKK
jgi:hypothetical protein